MKIADKEHSAVATIKHALEKAYKFQSRYNVFNWINDDAIKRAEEIDARIARGEKIGRLAGVPYALKNNFLSRQGGTTASAKILTEFSSPIDATTVAKLEAEGAIMIGRTNLDAFAHGSSTENSYFGTTKNACDVERVAGGSSGGSAVAVALGIVDFATGTDTGGSIRQPASFNGVYGFKPTYGAISRYGVVAMASSTDCIGFFTQNARDLDLLMRISAGQDSRDLTTLPNFYQDSKVQEVRKIGIIEDFDPEHIDTEVLNIMQKRVEQLQKSGYEVVKLSMPALKYALPAYYIIVPAEISSNLSRYDGVRYGWRSEEARDLDELYKQTRDQGFMPENKRRIMIGNFVLSAGFYDAYYLKAAKARTLIIQEYMRAFKQCDLILSLVAPNPAFKLGSKTHDPVSMYMEDIMTVPVSLAGLPALSIPVGKTAAGLPVGLQLIGPQRSDRTLLRFAEQVAELGRGEQNITESNKREEK